MRSVMGTIGLVLLAAVGWCADTLPQLRIEWDKNYLAIRGSFPGAEIKINYLEAFCRPGSTDRDWKETVIGHRTEKTAASADQQRIELQSTLVDGVIVDHVITAAGDEVDFRITAKNPSTTPSQAHWAQPCIRLDRFIGVPSKHSSEEYLPQSFIFVNHQLTRMPTAPWATTARYTPGQVWCPVNVDRNDVNPRPLSSIVPSNGLIGCFSADGKWMFATAFEPYQELFQGVIVCLHSDFRIGGLQPGETKTVRGKIYITLANVDRLLLRYQKDFPEHQAKKTS